MTATSLTYLSAAVTKATRTMPIVALARAQHAQTSLRGDDHTLAWRRVR